MTSATASSRALTGRNSSRISSSLHRACSSEYPHLLFALVLWLPLTVWLLLAQRRAQELWVGAAAFSISMLVLMFIGRTFNNYYLVWPLTGAAVAALMAAGERAVRAPP